MDLHKLFDKLKKNAVKLDFITESKKDLPIGKSKLGGRPDLAKDFKWFYYEGENFNGETKDRPLSFFWHQGIS
jgi:uncharacterized protein YwqG